MDRRGRRASCAVALVISALFALSAASAGAGGYDSALAGVKGISAVFDYSQGSPKVSNAVFWAVKNLYQDESVRALPEPARVAIVFHGPAVKLISTDRSGFEEAEIEELDNFADTLRKLKKDGVKLEVCLYAAKVMGVDPATIMPEIDRVANGFVSVVGYQAQGYGVVRVP